MAVVEVVSDRVLHKRLFETGFIDGGLRPVARGAHAGGQSVSERMGFGFLASLGIAAVLLTST